MLAALTNPPEGPISALGQKQTYAVQHGMSALHPKADMCGATRHVRFGPKADMSNRSKATGYSITSSACEQTEYGLPPVRWQSGGNFGLKCLEVPVMPG